MPSQMLKFLMIDNLMPDKRDARERRGDFDEIYGDYETEEAREQASRCSQCGIPFCQIHCPVQNNIPDWLKLSAEGRLEEAYEVSAATNNFPEICGRICPQDRLCEGNCVLEQAGHWTVTIGAVEKYITDQAWEKGWVKPPRPLRERDESVGVIGAGPGGMAALMESGGEREMLVDLADDLAVPFAQIGDHARAALAGHLDYGLEPVNPCDAWGTMDHYAETFAGCLAALVGDPDSAITLLFADLYDKRWLSDSYGDICKAQVKRADKPVVLATWVSRPRYGESAERLIADGVLVLDGVVPALKAVRNAFAYRDFRARPAPRPLAPPAAAMIARWRERLARGDALDEAESLALLADFDIPCAAVRIVEDRGDALRAAQAMGYPVALKTAMAGIHHKTDVDGVKLGLGDEGAVTAAYDDLADRLGTRVLVSAMAGPGVEMALGVIIDAQLGPLVMVAAGGVLVELLADTRTALPPFDAAAARRLIDGLALRQMLDGHRGAPAAQINALAEAVAGLSVLAATLGDRIAEIDINPLIAGPDGCIAVDALVVGRSVDHRSLV